MSNIERKYAYYDEGVLPEEGAYGTTYLTLYNSDAGNVYDGWLWDPDGHIPDPGSGDEHKRTFGYRNPDYPNYAWDDEVIVDLSNPQNRDDIEDVERGRITAFNTSVSDQPIVLEDVDITALTESEREAKATTVLFTAIPLVKDSYIQAAVEVQMKVNISPTNTTGMVRVEAFYILNDESDRTMRPNPVHTFAVATENERHTLPWLYFNPALNHEESNYIGVKLLVTGGTAEIGISDNPDYGDAMITLVSAGLVGDRVFDGKPVAIHLTGEEEVMPNYILHYGDYNVTCEYDTGEVYNITHMCEFSPRMGTEITEDFTLTATYQGLSDSMEVMVLEVDHIELVGLDFFEDAYTLNPYDYTVRGYFIRTGTQETIVRDVTERATYAPAMGTTITQDSTLVATYHGVSDSLNITKLGSPVDTKTVDGFIYKLYYYGGYDKYVCKITGHSINEGGDPLSLVNAFPTYSTRQKIKKVDIWCGGYASSISIASTDATQIYDHTASDFYENVTNLKDMFRSGALIRPPHYQPDKKFGKVTSINSMFRESSSIDELYWKYNTGWMRNLDLSECLDMGYAFYRSSICDTKFMSSWDMYTDKIRRAAFTFADCANLKDFSGIRDLFNHANNDLTSINGMFRNIAVSIIPELHWNVRHVTNMIETFNVNSSGLGVSDASGISGWRPQRVESMGRMFSGHKCRDFSDLEYWNPPNTAVLSDMFYSPKIDPVTGHTYDPIKPSWYHE